MNYQKKAAALILKQIRDAGGQKTFDIARSASTLRLFEKMTEAGQIHVMKREGQEITYSIKPTSMS